MPSGAEEHKKEHKKQDKKEEHKKEHKKQHKKQHENLTDVQEDAESHPPLSPYHELRVHIHDNSMVSFVSSDMPAGSLHQQRPQNKNSPCLLTMELRVKKLKKPKTFKTLKKPKTFKTLKKPTKLKTLKTLKKPETLEKLKDLKDPKKLEKLEKLENAKKPKNPDVPAPKKRQRPALDYEAPV